MRVCGNAIAVEVGNPDDHAPEDAGSLTLPEQQALFSLWAGLKSPLVIGADPRKLSSEALAILLNAEVLAVNQDPLAAPVRQIGSINSWSLNLTPPEILIAALLLECRWGYNTTVVTAARTAFCLA